MHDLRICVGRYYNNNNYYYNVTVGLPVFPLPVQVTQDSMVP